MTAPLPPTLLFPHTTPPAPGSAAPLLAIGGDRRTLQIALMADRHGNLFVGDEIFKLEFGALVHNLRAPRIPVFVTNLFEFLHDHSAQLGVTGKDRLVLCDLFAYR